MTKDRIQSLLLNLPLVGLFACAWISDRWPDLMAPALVLAAALTLFEVIALGAAARRRTTTGAVSSQAKVHLRDDKSEGSTAEVLIPAVQVEVYPSSTSLATAALRERHLVELQLRRALVIEQLREVKALSRASMEALVAVRSIRPRASEVSLWVTAERRAVEMQLRRAALHRRVGPDYWRLIPNDANSFTIDAGVFEIEYFGGQTNIRIHDPSKVTIEGSERGAPVPNLPPDLKPPRYN